MRKKAIGSLKSGILLMMMTQLAFASNPPTVASEIPSKTLLPAPRLRVESITVAGSKKTNAKIKEGLIIGGDRSIDQVLIKDIRFSIQSGYERIVIDLEGSHKGEPPGIPRAPYYQIEIAPEHKRIGISIWGQPQLTFDPHKVKTLFKKSTIFKSIDLLPKVEDDVWTFSLPIKSDAAVEVFELSQPTRIIMDITHKKG
jgi:hypothetical protein